MCLWLRLVAEVLQHGGQIRRDQCSVNRCASRRQVEDLSPVNLLHVTTTEQRECLPWYWSHYTSHLHSFSRAPGYSDGYDGESLPRYSTQLGPLDEVFGIIHQSSR